MFYLEELDLLISISLEELEILVNKQLSNMFLLKSEEEEIVKSSIKEALKKCKFCFKPNLGKYFHFEDKTFFNPFHSGQYCIFLYYLSKVIYRIDKTYLISSICDRIYYLNKLLNSVDLYYRINLPNIFMLDHPLGSVMGNAKYNDGFAFSQNCTVGCSKGNYPILGQNVWMSSDSKILGKSIIGNNVIVAANTYIKDLEVPDFSIVFGSPIKYSFKPLTPEFMNKNYNLYKIH